MTTKLFLILSIVLTLIFSASIIFAGAEKEAPPVEVKPLIIGTTDKLTGSIDSAQAYDFHTWEIFYNMSSGLLNYTPGTAELELGLAADWPIVSPDGLEYTFKLKKGLNNTVGFQF